jgi:hypothetical protein
MRHFDKDYQSFITTSITIATIATLSLFVFEIDESRAEESYTGVVLKKCTFSYTDQIENRSMLGCFARVDGVVSIFGGNQPISIKENVILDPVNPSITMEELNTSRVWKSKVSSPSIPQQKYDNVAEPSFASNGTSVLYAGNHFAARSVIGEDWEYVDPSFDFKGLEEANATDSNSSRRVTPIFKADQHVEYDPIRKMYLWVRQSEQVFVGGGLSNIDRLAISRDLDHWAVYDLISTRILNQAGIIEPVFDYPDTVLTDRYLYLTTSVYSDNAKYGLIFRLSLDDLSNSLDRQADNRTAINYELKLDRDVETVAPIDGASDPMYFGTHLPNNTALMKIYSWFNNSTSLNSTEIAVTPWNGIKNRAACANPEWWWCNANITSRITSAWLSDNTINFLWNAIISYDRGSSWLPYIDSATFYVNDSLRYERKYHLADSNTFWVFGAVSPNNQGDLGVGALYVDTRLNGSLSSPYVNYAFGVFDETKNKWGMMPIINSSAPLPVQNEKGKEDYNIGDFLTTKAHIGNDGIYSWGAGGYIIVGPKYNEIEPYFIKIKN